MPTYVYACNACGSQFEKVQSFKDEPLNTCPCGQEGSVRRVFQPVGIVFKGSGWYITDSRKSDSAGVSAAAANGEAKAETADAKPADATAPETKSGDAQPAAAKPAETKATSESTSAPAAT
jgi:putative FmdB family regulatory protein